jgi:hypothetical protein
MQVNRKHILLLLVFAFSFIFRIILMLWNTYPSGADIGLHNSVIYSITGSGNTSFLWNFYQIGGGLSLTFPGYHIFAAGVMMMTGLPEYIAHAATVSLFSSLIVLAAFLVTRRVWNETAAFIVAFLAAVSRFDIEMLLWGGYPNVITLLLIPLIFYLFLQKDRFSKTPFLFSTSILVGSMFLTHSLSAAIFVAITVLTVLFVVISPKTFGTSRITGVYWLVPLVLGVAFVSPFLVNAVPAYLSQNSSAMGVQGVSDINSAVLSTRILPLEQVLPLFLIILGFALFSRRYNGKYITLPTLLLCMWLFIPLFLTQGYLFGFIIDYNRFQYFVILPVLIFIAVLIAHGSEFFANGIQIIRALNVKVQNAETAANKKVAWISAHATKKSLFASFILFFLLFSALVLPIFMTPSQNMGQSIQSFYQFMNQPRWEAIQWIKANTSGNAVLVSDPHYGWWLSGFALRPTLSAVDPQYLTLAREFPIAKNATNLLDTDFLVDNYLVQVREDGGYLARHNPEILANLNWTYFPYSFFTFDGSQTEITYSNGNRTSISLSDLEVRDMRLISNADQATILVNRGNDYFNYTQLTTVYRGMRFVNLTSTLTSTVPGVIFEGLRINVQSKGTQIPYDDQRTVAMVDVGVKTFGQLIFEANQPKVSPEVSSPLFIELKYLMQNSTNYQIQILSSAYSADNNPAFYTDSQSIDDHFYPVIAENVNHPYPTPTNDGFKECFDYRKMLQSYNVTYVACTVPEMYPKFTRDAAFSLVFINSEVAVFSVKGNLGQDG